MKPKACSEPKMTAREAAEAIAVLEAAMARAQNAIAQRDLELQHEAALDRRTRARSAAY